MRRSKKRGPLRIGILVFLLLSVGVAASGWLGMKVISANESLVAANQLVPQLQRDVLREDSVAAAETVDRLKFETAKAREASEDPMWSLATVLPWAGSSFAAAREAARSADDVVQLGAVPLLETFQALKWNELVPTEAGADLTPLVKAQPRVVAAAQAVRESSERLNAIETDGLLPQIAAPLDRARGQLDAMRDSLDAAADAASIAPAMMGADAPRQYLLMVQNNAELRATGGIPGALAVLSIDKGQLAITQQSSAAELGMFDPPLGLEPDQQQIYSARMGKFMQDVNLTPDFPTTARTAQAMWETKYGLRVDGVLSIDPVALSYFLKATGPVSVSGNEIPGYEGTGLPSELTEENVVRTLLSDVYSKVAEPELQDAYFARVAQEVFETLSNAETDAKELLKGVTRGVEEGRVLIWSGKAAEQEALARYPLSGSISGSSISPAQFGVYFNDGTGAKMDYYVQRTVQLIKQCPKDGYHETTVRITTTNTAPADASTSLPAYVTGGGNFGVPSGSVQTNFVVYGPAQANAETASSDGIRTEFAPYVHASRPVGVMAVRLAPGESKTTELTFGKIVQDTEPNVVVTPTIQDVKDVILPTGTAPCG